MRKHEHRFYNLNAVVRININVLVFWCTKIVYSMSSAPQVRERDGDDGGRGIAKQLVVNVNILTLLRALREQLHS